MNNAEYLKKQRATRKALYCDGVVCAHCGGPHEEWHHVDPSEKDRTIEWKRTIKWIEAELAKCIPLCKPCHRKVHEPKHGTAPRYNNQGCRCNLCKEAHAKRAREYRARKACA